MPHRRKTSLVRKTAASTALVFAAGPKVATGVRALMNLHRGMREDRLETLWDHLLRDEADPLAFSRRVESAVLRDGDEVAYAFIAAARSAVDAVDPSALISIGLLARRFINTNDPSRREYAAYLDMFESLDAIEFGVLRHAVQRLRALPRDNVHTTTTHFSLTAGVEWAVSGGEPVLANGIAAVQIIRGFEKVLEARGIAPTPQMSPTIPWAVVELLAEVVPQAG